MAKKIKSTDLRIGNYLQDSNGRLCVVQEIRQNEFRAYAINGPITSHPLKPIRITEKLLLELGFKKELNGWFDKKFFTKIDADDVQLMSINIKSGRFSISILDFSETTYTSKEVLYYHQLQNIYFILAGKELIYITQSNGKKESTRKEKTA